MKKGLTEVIFILDRSGSMSGLESDTIGGFDSMIEKQKKEEGEAIISTVLFDNEVEVLHDRVSLKDLDLITNKEYYVRGCTALLDAIGGAIHHISVIHKYARDEDRPEKTLFVIITDGLENSSKQYSYKKVKKMVENQKKLYGWEFLFLGANIEAIEVAGQFGIQKDYAVNFECDSAGIALHYDVLSDVVGELRGQPSCAVPVSWKEKIEKDYKKRHRK